MKNSFYSRDELETLGFASIGNNVQISRNASIYGCENMQIGSNVRIDDFCILSGKIILDNYIHIAAYSSLFGGNIGIRMNDYSTISSRTAVYAKSDDYSGEYMTNPTVPSEYTHVVETEVIIGKHVVVGSGSTILPGSILGEGVAVGAMSLVNKSLEPWGIYAGIPCKRIKERSRELIKYEEQQRIS